MVCLVLFVVGPILCAFGDTLRCRKSYASKKPRTALDFESLETSLWVYKIQTGRSCPSDLHALVEQGIIKRAPNDPWGNPYVVRCWYWGEIELRSAGPDGELGTRDDISHSFTPPE